VPGGGSARAAGPRRWVLNGALGARLPKCVALGSAPRRPRVAGAGAAGCCGVRGGRGLPSAGARGGPGAQSAASVSPAALLSQRRPRRLQCVHRGRGEPSSTGEGRGLHRAGGAMGGAAGRDWPGGGAGAGRGAPRGQRGVSRSRGGATGRGRDTGGEGETGGWLKAVAAVQICTGRGEAHSGEKSEVHAGEIWVRKAARAGARSREGERWGQRCAGRGIRDWVPGAGRIQGRRGARRGGDTGGGDEGAGGITPGQNGAGGGRGRLGATPPVRSTEAVAVASHEVGRLAPAGGGRAVQPPKNRGFRGGFSRGGSAPGGGGRWAAITRGPHRGCPARAAAAAAGGGRAALGRAGGF
jgi:hypothetical protein